MPNQNHLRKYAVISFVIIMLVSPEEISIQVANGMGAHGYGTVVTFSPSGSADRRSTSGAVYSSNDRTEPGSMRLPAAPARSTQETRWPEPRSRGRSLNQHQAPWPAPCTRKKCSLLSVASPPASISSITCTTTIVCAPAYLSAVACPSVMSYLYRRGQAV